MARRKKSGTDIARLRSSARNRRGGGSEQVLPFKDEVAREDLNRSSGNSDRTILVQGARVHNLKNISVELPRNRLIVFTGVSGSGKSSLAFDTIYAEGQRRYVESLSSYARQFLERMDKPDVDVIQGISPAMAIEQKTNTRNPRSTVGTTTEIYDYFRLLFSRVGRTYCSGCGRVVRRESVVTVLERLDEELSRSEEFRARGEAKIYALFPLRERAKASPKDILENLKNQGFFRVLYKNEIVDLNKQALGKAKLEDVHVLVDRLVYRKHQSDGRFRDSLETAFNSGEGYASVLLVDLGKLLKFSQHFECVDCRIRYEEPQPRLFSFNNPFGACSKCQGFGRSVGIDMDLVVPDRSKTLRAGAVVPWTSPKFRDNLRALLQIAREAKVRVDVPFSDLTEEELAVVMNGYGDFDGLHRFFQFIERKSYKIHYRVFLSRYRGYTTCDACNGARLRPEALNVRIDGKTIHDLVRMSIAQVGHYFATLELSAYEREVSARILEELRRRLKYLVDVGIGYLTLDRLSSTLSGGESQRINLATALGSSLVGSLYVLDEPSIGLHPRDNHKLIGVLRSLRDVGNTVIVVEHDSEMIRASDLVVDLGPRAGEQGGEIVFEGPVEELLRSSDSLTGKYLSGELSIPVPETRRDGNGKVIVVRGAAQHNLKNIDVRIPLNEFVCITGVSGSGKSTLIHEILYAGLKKMKGGRHGAVGAHRAIEGADLIDDVELVDQAPIGRTPRSNPVTYIKAFDVIRELFANTQAAKVHGLTAGSFSFNVPGGRCDACQGDGFVKVEMQFLADLYLTCEVCKGKRYKSAVLDVKYRGKNIHEILNMTVSEAIRFFKGEPVGRRAVRRLKVLEDVGLGYLRLGQSATTLSGGEAQRVKLSAHLAQSEQVGEGQILFIFDEPTTGLHFDDISKLLKCFEALIEAGHSVVIIEHNMDVIKCADYVIDLGPEGGDAGGRVVGLGRPEEIAKREDSYTGKFLRHYLPK